MAQFKALLESDPEVGTFVYDLVLGEHQVGFYRELPEECVRFDSGDSIPCVLASFTQLKAFSLHSPLLSGVYGNRLSGIYGNHLGQPPPPPLEALDFISVPKHVALLLCSSLRDAPDSTLRSFSTIVSDDQDTNASAMHVFSFFGDSLTELSITFDVYSGLQALFETSSFTMQDCTNLRVIHLKVHIHGMCDITNHDLRGIPTILGQISSPHLEEITLSILADPMSDYHGLDSECGVRGLSLTTFAGLAELDWDAINNALTREGMSSLRTLTVVARGPKDPLHGHLATWLPMWKTVSLYSVETSNDL
ncbi:hypothetical protein EUX98_g1234 [Antrodiella citrinella]|uniref:Uncharacterized protein n=1 Tax=Antrodiella citrinella TaxID=2447956 RepID=A0A4S4N1X7_9APHY|nr:hypothetical protein EUX98_g1234 [Antrodiella citrinella]